MRWSEAWSDLYELIEQQRNVKCLYDDVETDFQEPAQVDDLEASDNGGIYL